MKGQDTSDSHIGRAVLVTDTREGPPRAVQSRRRTASNAELLDMATDLRAAGYKDAAAVIAGTALELHLRALAPKHGISLLDSKQRPKKADALKVELRQAAVVSPLVEKQITVWLGLRNAAAHGNYGEYIDAQIDQLNSDVLRFITDYPA